VDISPKDFAGSFKGFLDKVAAQAPAKEPIFVKHLKAHFGEDPAKLPVVAEAFDPSEHPNVQVALDGWLIQKGRSHELHGVVAGQSFVDGRKAALFAADERAEIIVEDRHLDQALHELFVEGGDLTKSLLGFGAATKRL
jgi:hypothetical protein